MVNTHIGLETETMVVFGIVALFALSVDIWVHRKDKPIALKSAIMWTLFWIAVSMCFALFLYVHFNGEVASLFLAGYLFEQALSVVIGSALFAMGPVVEFFFALLVAASGFMMLRKKDDSEGENADYSHHIAFRAVRLFFPVFPRLVGHSFFVSQAHVNEEMKKPENQGLVLKRHGPLFATPLFVYSAMIFAVLGLRSMYFVLDAMRQYLIHLEKAVTILLFFIAFKLAASASLHLFGFGIDISVYTSLIVIAVILGLGIVASFIFPDKSKKAAAPAAATDVSAAEPAPVTEATPVAEASTAEATTAPATVEVSAAEAAPAAAEAVAPAEVAAAAAAAEDKAK